MDAQALFKAHHASLYRYLVRLTGDYDLAQDAVQEAFARLLTRPPRDDQLRAWLFTVATNYVRATANSRRRRLTLLLQKSATPVAAGEGSGDPEELAVRADRRRIVRNALEQMSEKERTILLMREEGFSHCEIASAVGTTTGSVGTMIARALEKLSAIISLDHSEL